MADFFLSEAANNIFPVGTTVGAYLESAMRPNGDGSPLGPVLIDEEMTATGLTFTGLEHNTGYVAAAEVESEWRYIGFRTDIPPSGLPSGPLLEGDYGEESIPESALGFEIGTGDVDTHAADTTDVHGIADTSALLTSADFFPWLVDGIAEGELDITGAVDATSALNTLITDTAGEGKTLFLGPGTFKVSGALLEAQSGLRLVGAGMDLTTISVASANADESIITLGTTTDIRISDLTLNGNSIVNCKRGIYSTGGSGARALVLERVRVRDVIDNGTATPKTWRGLSLDPCASVKVLDCEFLDCGQGAFVTNCDGETVFRGCLFDGSGGLMTDGIQTNASSEAWRPVLIEGCVFQHIQFDQSVNGVNGHGVVGFNHQGMRVIGNEFRDTYTSGVLLGVGCGGAKAIGNSCYQCIANDLIRGSGVYVETNPTDGTFGTAGEYLSCIVQGNTMIECQVGIVNSYSPGTVIQGNVIIGSYLEGIRNDSAGTIISENVVMNNWQSGNSSAITAQNGAIQAVGEAAILRGNLCIDNQATPTQEYGIALSNDPHVLHGNVCHTNLTGGIYFGNFAVGGPTYKNNIVRTGTAEGVMETVASAGTPVVSDDTEIALITGTTQISNLSNSWPGRMLTLKFADALTVVHSTSGLNLRGSVNFITGAGDTLTLFHDNANWYEVARVQAAAVTETIASAATLAPTRPTEFILCTGTTTVSDLSGQFAGRRVTLKFDSSIQVTHGVNGINLAGAANFAATANDTLSLISDGTNWYETARTVI